MPLAIIRLLNQIRILVNLGFDNRFHVYGDMTIPLGPGRGGYRVSNQNNSSLAARVAGLIKITRIPKP